MKWAGIPNGAPSSVVNTHSNREGGDTAFSADRIDLVTIQRWGAMALIYLPRICVAGIRWLTASRGEIAHTRGLNKYLTEATMLHTRTLVEEFPHFHNGRSRGSDFRSLLPTRRWFYLPLLISTNFVDLRDPFIYRDFVARKSSLFPSGGWFYNYFELRLPASFILLHAWMWWYLSTIGSIRPFPTRFNAYSLDYR